MSTGWIDLVVLCSCIDLPAEGDRIKYYLADDDKSTFPFLLSFITKVLYDIHKMVFGKLFSYFYLKLVFSLIQIIKGLESLILLVEVKHFSKLG